MEKSSQQTNDTLSVKINVVGSGGTGKTRYIIEVGNDLQSDGYQIENLKQWHEDLTKTVGGYLVNIHDYEVQKDDTNNTYDFAVWDLGGQLRYGDVRKVYLEETSGILATIDLARSFSLEILKEAMLKDEVQKVCEENIPIVLVGNKTDLRSTIRENKTEIAQVIFNAIDEIIENKQTSYKIKTKVGGKNDVKEFNEPTQMLGDRPSLKVADFEASIYKALDEEFSTKDIKALTAMNIKLLAREIWFVITNSLFLGMMGEGIPYNIVERASLGVPLFREYMRSPDVLVPLDFTKAEIEEFLEEILVDTERLEKLANELKEAGFNVIYTEEVSAITKKDILKPFQILLKHSAQFADQQKRHLEEQSEDIEEGFKEF